MRFVLYALTSLNTDRFSNLFHCQNPENICNSTVTKDLTTPQVCRYTTLRNVNVLKATLENKTRARADDQKQIARHHYGCVIHVSPARITATD